MVDCIHEILMELRTAKEVLKIYNSIMPELRCTSELAEEFENNRLTTLDTKLWVETVSGKLEYQFYEKPMSSRFLICKDSTLPENKKMSSLTQNLIRRLKHTSERLPIF